MRCGIDFGTSNTTMAVLHPEGSRLVPLENQSVTIPTAVFFPENKHQPILFGREAVRAYLDGHEGRFMRSLKRALGTSIMQQGTIIRGARWQFTRIIGHFLEHIKQAAETHLGQELTEVTMGRPVHFQDNDPGADARAENELREIAQDVGFADVRFQYEPIAAALSHERNIGGEQLALVIDIGGGTSDFSVIRLSNAYASDRNRAQDILANTGVRIGGNDCDKAINIDVAMPLLGLGSLYGDKDLEMPRQMYYELSEWAKVNWCYTPQNENWVRGMIREAHEPERLMRLERVLEEHMGHRILNVSEDIKITLTEQKHIVADYNFLDTQLGVTVKQDDVHHLLERTLRPVQMMMLDTLQQAGVTADDIAVVILTGGTTGLPLFRGWLTQFFPKSTVLDDNRLDSVGLGLVL